VDYFLYNHCVRWLCVRWLCVGCIKNLFKYNDLIRVHPIFMVFFMIISILIGGLDHYLLPLLLVMKDLVFSRIHSLSLWLAIMSSLLVILTKFYDEVDTRIKYLYTTKYTSFQPV
jgi:heme/copper-type cytochrome/quinol oxidase subunit 1